MNRIKKWIAGFLPGLLFVAPAWPQGIHGTVVDHQDRPIPGAIVYAVENNAAIRLNNNDVLMPEKYSRVLSNKDGAFSFPESKRPIKILLARDLEDRFAWITDPALDKNNQIIIHEPARLAGQLWRGKSPVPQKEITALLMTGSCRFSYRATTQTDPKGQFAFDSLPAGKYLVQTIDPVPQVGCCFRNVPTRQVQVTLSPAQSLNLKIGGSDLPWLHGKITDTDGRPLHGVWVYLTSNSDKNIGPGSWSDITTKNGEFAIYDVPPGPYTLHGFRRLALNNSSRTLQTAQPLTITDRTNPDSSVVPFAENVADIAIDLSPFLPLEIGAPVPPLKKRTLAGSEFDIEKEQGKIVVLHFYASWCVPCVKDFPNYDKLLDRFGSRNLTVVSINLDETLEDCQAFLKDHAPHHPQIFAGPWTHSWAVSNFHIADVPSTIIVNSQGRILQRDLFDRVLAEFIQQQLSSSDTKK